MKIALLTLILIFSSSTYATETSSVYTCKFTDTTDTTSIRMKKYFDATENMQLGKVDLMMNSEVIESTPTRVYQIPLLDNQTYVQIWNAKEVSVDAQLSYSQGGREFRATYTKSEKKKEIICKELRD